MGWCLLLIAAVLIAGALVAVVEHVRAGRDLDRRLDELDRQLREDRRD